MSYGMDYQGGDTYGGGGGGFNTGGDNFGTPSASQGSAGGGGTRRNYDDQTIIPVTARMILSGEPQPGDTLKLQDDRTLYHVKLVGAIRSVEKNSTNVNYQIEDGTGLVDVKMWVDENGCTATQEMMEAASKAEHKYVKIVGKVKVYDNKSSVIADTVRVLSTGNELAHHFLEVVYSGEKYKNSSTIVQPTSPMMGISHSNAAGNSGGVGFGGSTGGRTPLMAQGGGGGTGDDLKDSVLNYIRRNAESSEYGANIDLCIKSLPQHNEGDIRAAVEHLQTEGMLYSTVNEEHYKCAM